LFEDLDAVGKTAAQSLADLGGGTARTAAVGAPVPEGSAVRLWDQGTYGNFRGFSRAFVPSSGHRQRLHSGCVRLNLSWVVWISQDADPSGFICRCIPTHETIAPVVYVAYLVPVQP